MLEQALTVPATAGGAAVVAARTDAWTGLRLAVARWFSRVDEQREDIERAQAVEELCAVLAQHTSQGGASAGEGGLAVGGNVGIRAEKGSIAAGVIHGGAHVERGRSAGDRSRKDRRQTGL